jgi:hypothetical protein
MTTLCTILGALFLFALGMLFLFSLFCLVSHYHERQIEKRWEKRWQEFASSLAQRMRGDSWWFSEDVPTMELIKDMADDIARCGTPHAEALRDRWRKNRGKP